MKQRIYILLLLILIPLQMEAQKVGLVLSGGGAKGLTHIGIIRALEENEIPIDYNYRYFYGCHCRLTLRYGVFS